MADLCTVEDIEARVGRTFDAVERTRVQAAITDVSALIEDFCGLVFADPVPPVIAAIAAQEVRRLINVEPGVSTERIEALSQSYAHGGAVVQLSPDTVRALRRYMARRRGSVWSIRLVRPDCPEEGDE